MRKFVLILMMILGLGNTIYAATPLTSYMELRDGRHIITKTFEASPDEDPLLLRERDFEQDGFSYSYYETAKEEIPVVQKRQEIQIMSATTEDNKVQFVLQQFLPEIDYESEDGYKGKLLLNHASVKTETEGYITKTFTVKDEMTIMGLSNNDPASIPKTTSKDGITLNLQNVDWSAQESETVDFNTIPTKYKAIAYYSGSYTKEVPTGYISTVEYTGEVEKISIDKVIYTLTYIGSEIPPPAPESLPAPDTALENENTFKWWIIAVLICLLIIISAVTAFFILFYNTFILAKQ